MISLISCIVISSVFIVDYLLLPSSDNLKTVSRDINGYIDGFSRGHQTVEIHGNDGERFDIRCQSVVEICEGGYLGRQVSIDVVKVSSLGDYFGMRAYVDDEEVVSQGDSTDRYTEHVVSHLIQTLILVLVTALIALFSRSNEQ